MTTVKISELPTGTLSGDSELPASAAGSTIKTTPNSIVASSADGLNTITADYTLQASDSRKFLIVDSLSPVAITIVDSTGFPNGFNFGVMRKGTGTVAVTGSGFSVTVGQFNSAELSSVGSVAKLTKLDANEWVVRGDLKETQPRARFTLDGASVSGPAVQIDISAIQGQDGAPSAWQLEADGTATCLISGLYSFQGNIIIGDTSTSTNRLAGVSFRRNGSTYVLAEGIREGSASINISAIMASTLPAEVGDVFQMITKSGGTTVFPSGTTSRQFFVSRISD